MSERSPSLAASRSPIVDLGAGVEQPRRLGALGARLARLHGLGVPVLPGFVITTDAWEEFLDAGGGSPASIGEALDDHVAALEASALALDPGAGEVHLRLRLTRVVAAAETGQREARPPAARSVRGRGAEVAEEVRERVLGLWRDHAQTPGASAVGAAVVVQVAAPMAPASAGAYGVAVTRDPATASPGATGWARFLDAGAAPAEDLDELRRRAPVAHATLHGLVALVEAAFRDMCELPFAVCGDALWLLDARAAERSGPAAVRAAVELVDEGIIDVGEALDRVPVAAAREASAPVVMPGQALEVVGRGLPLVGGAARGVVRFDVQAALASADRGEAVVLVARALADLEARDLGALAAVVLPAGRPRAGAPRILRPLGLPAIGDVVWSASAHGAALSEGEQVTVDGNAGVLLRGAAELLPSQPDLSFARFRSWCEERAQLPVLAAAPDGWTRVDDPVAAATVVGPGVVVPATARRFEEVVEVLLERGIARLALELGGPGADRAAIRAPWTSVVAPAGWESAGLLAAARLRAPDAGLVGTHNAPAGRPSP